jgi:hypothetical protein
MKNKHIAPDKLATCKRCNNSQLAWVQSAKTRRWYLCDTMHGFGSMRQVAPWSPHTREKCAHHKAEGDKLRKMIHAERGAGMPTCVDCDNRHYPNLTCEQVAELIAIDQGILNNAR